MESSGLKTAEKKIVEILNKLVVEDKEKIKDYTSKIMAAFMIGMLMDMAFKDSKDN